MKKLSAGILVYRYKGGQIEVLLGHPGGPFYTKKDQGVWSIPKGEYEVGDEPLEAAKREFEEEVGHTSPKGEFSDLGEAKLSSKIITAYAVEGDIDTNTVKSNSFEMEWPPKSGKMQQFPEIDKTEWFSIDKALGKISKGQIVFLERLAEKLDVPKLESEQQQLL